MKTLTRLKGPVLGALLGALAALPIASMASSSAPAAFPEPGKMVKVIVPFVAGGGVDSAARLFAEQLRKQLGTTVIVENRVGGSGVVGGRAVLAAAPDGYTLLFSAATHVLAKQVLAHPPYDPQTDFVPVARVGELPFALLVHPSVPAKTVQELIDYAKANPDRLSYGTPNSTSLVASETFKYVTHAQITSVPYKSSPQALTDLMGNQIQVYVADLGSAWGTIKTDRVRTLAVTAAKGSTLLPNVPAIGKTLPGFDITSWNGIFGPAGMPVEITERLNTELQAILKDKAVQEQLAQVGFEVWPTATPAEFATYVKDQMARWGQLVKQAGIEAQ